MDQRSAKRAVGSRRHQPASGNLDGWAIDRVHQVDCVEMLRSLPDASVDLAIADPPYNLAKGGHWSWDATAPLPGFGGPWQKAMPAWDDRPLADYLAFTLTWLRELGRVVRPTGSLWIHGTYHNAGILNVALQLLGIEIINEVVWYKRNSFPNLSGRRLTASHETILWAHTGGKRRQYFFNYEAARAMECPEDPLKVPGRQLRTVWDIPNNKGREELEHGKHPTQKPLRLLMRMLTISARPGDLVLVPFAGSGSECVAARNFGAHFLAAETDAQYVRIASRRLNRAAQTEAASHRSPTAQQPTELKKPRTGSVTMPSNGTKMEPCLETKNSRRAVPSLLKWTGSKRSQAASIAALIPPHKRYLEPFLGGGAVLYYAAGEGTVAGDSYGPLIELWQLVQANPDRVIADYRRQWTLLQQELDSLGEDWNSAAAPARPRTGTSKTAEPALLPQYYYRVRERFNRAPNPLDLNFLLRTCVNGIVRFNAAGRFNNSFHLSRRGMQPDRFANTVAAWVPRLQGVRFVCQDYEVTVADARRGDFVYFDPPYAGNHQRYTQNLDCERLFAVLDALNRREVRWALSFDGRRGNRDLTYAVPKSLYRRQVYLDSGNSAVHKVLNGPVEKVQESLYLNFD